VVDTVATTVGSLEYKQEADIASWNSSAGADTG